MRMNKVAAAVGTAAVVGVALSATPVSALSLTVDGSTYDVIVETTNFDDLRGRDEFDNLLPWFNNEPLARSIATAAGLAHYEGVPGNLGRPHEGGFTGPLFAFGAADSVLWTSYQGNDLRTDGTVTLVAAGAFSPNNDAPYAIVDLEQAPDPIPTPALLPGLVGMGLAAMRKRNQASAD